MFILLSQKKQNKHNFWTQMVGARLVEEIIEL